MFTASFYDSTGRIIGVMSGPRESVEATSEVTGDPFVEGASNPDLHYVRDGAIVDRPESPAILSVSYTHLDVYKRQSIRSTRSIDPAHIRAASGGHSMAASGRAGRSCPRCRRRARPTALPP